VASEQQKSACLLWQLHCWLVICAWHQTSIEVVGWSGGKRDVAPLARRAIKGLATMLTKDSCLHYQSEADAVKVSMHPCKHAVPVDFPAPDVSDHEHATAWIKQAIVYLHALLTLTVLLFAPLDFAAGRIHGACACSNTESTVL